MRFWDGMKALMHKLSILPSREEKCFKYFPLKSFKKVFSNSGERISTSNGTG